MNLFSRIENYVVAGITASVFAIGAIAMAKTEYPAFDLEKISNGEWQAATEASFNDQNPVREFYIQTYNALQYAGFGQVQDGVVIGKKRWLFTQEEFQVDADFAANIDSHLSFVGEAIARLEANGTKTIVTLLPDKARVMDELNTAHRAEAVEGRYIHIVNTLRAQGTPMLSTFEALRGQRNTTPVFLRTDTHWSAEGAILVAQESVKALGAVQQNSAKRLEKTGTRIHRGDLYNFLDLGPYHSVLGFEYEEASDYQLHSGGDASSASLFGSEESELYLVGTSYSADTRWSFADALEATSGHKVLNYAEMGTGPFKPMRDLLEELEQSGEYPEFLVWEIPERYVSQPDEQMENQRG